MKLALPGLALLLAAGAQEKPAPAASSKVVIIPIVDELDSAHVALVKRAVKRIKEEKPDLVIVEIDTPGGRIDYMLTMGEDLMSLAPIPTAAFVRPMGQGGMTGGAWSAGAFLAMSCKRLYMYPGTVIGAAAPVTATSEGVKPVEEKYVSAFREKFRARAEQNGYPPNLAVAMVDKDLEVFEVTVEGKKLYLTAAEMEKLRAEGKEFEWPKSPFDSKEKLLTLTDRQVKETGMGSIVSDRREIYADLGLTAAPQEIAVQATWSEHLVVFLTSPLVAFLLIAGTILGFWIEFKTPGFGMAGVVGILCLGLLLFGHHLAGLADVSEVLLIVLGIGLVMVEIFLFPGVGVFAIAGVLCVLGGLVLSLQDFTLPDPKGAPWQVDVLLGSLGRIVSAFIGAGVGVLILLRYLDKVPFFNRLVIKGQLAGAAPAPVETAVSTGESLAGRMGHAVTPLRPGGKIEIDGQVHDVVAEGEFVASGEPVEVLRVEGIRVVVGKVKR